MKKYLILPLLVLLSGCAIFSTPGPKDNVEAEAQFTRVSDDFIQGYLAWRPATGTSLGLHEYDGKMTDFSRASVEAERARLHRFDKELAKFPADLLNPQSRHDLRVMQTAIADELFSFDDMRAYTQNPMTYAEAIDVNIYIKRNFAPLEDRVRSIITIEKQAPAIMVAARANLDDSLPQPYVETAMEVADGAADFLGKDLVEALNVVTNQTLMAEFKTVNDAAIAALKDYSAWLKKEKLPKAHNHYALGREKFQRMIRDGELIQQTPEQVLDIGLKALHHEQEVFATTAKLIDSDKKPIDVFKEIQKDHPTAESLIPDVRKDLESIHQFLVDHQIVTLPSDTRVMVLETPQYMRATTFASMDSPGPFETKATEAYYYVTPTEKDWPQEQKDEWLTSFNYYTTDVVSIHEAYPGHFVQFMCEQASSATRLEKIFESYAFTEGWAHYCEQMLVDQGFGAEDTSPAGQLRAAKYRLAQSDEALLRLCRLCVSIKTHCEGMTLDEATKFFEDNCYYEPKPARQEAIRGTFDPGYLYYTLGKLQFLKLRHDYQEQEGANFTLKGFHDEVLRHGNCPIRLLREIMLKDPRQWDQLF